jgi:hypothetical protein
MIKKIKNIISYISKCRFFPGDGYYHLPFLADSPQKMIEGFKNLPFTKTDESRNLIIAENFWVDIKVWYIELESGLWLMVNDAKFKANIFTHAIYEQPFCNYYSLYYYTNKRIIASNYIRSMNVDLVSKTWTLHSPKSKIERYIAKDTNALFFSFFFDRDWVRRNINYLSLPDNNPLKIFFTDELGTFICNDFTTNVDDLTERIFEYLENRSTKSLQTKNLPQRIIKLLTGLKLSWIKP